ncbi:pullulanase-type alpha-1,6-glucosidase [Parvularcula sp. ZS-1/3]|uniref:Pullulanase-type alpha-1,6-glucosidase n=1 Tax=Parvularcula mediterranea TaxID=2732508 RepID=A0A7Y3RNE7_9PROT|nr:pullulanase-type alpha-1,6-glucosidase [Parvularcula mediterranea]NNU16830.1 pullulanase-type alpha-1,6-glucosidase [Parvularcula mediterranea]
MIRPLAFAAMLLSSVSVAAAETPALDGAKAHWIDKRTVLLPPGGPSVPVLEAGGETIELKEGKAKGLADRYPHLQEYDAYKLPRMSRTRLSELLRGPIYVTTGGPEAQAFATGLQIPGVLDELYANEKPLGVQLKDGVPTLSVWAPTAANVSLRLFADGNEQKVEMRRDHRTGIWSAEGDEDWMGAAYLYEVDVFAPAEGRMVTNLVTDPYSLALTTDSERSLIVDLSDEALTPQGWDDLDKPALEAPEDIVIYELHVRDFSISDETVDEKARGKFAAFTEEDSLGMGHLLKLEEAGLTHIHLLPSFDCATIPEDMSVQVASESFAGLPPASEEPQARSGETRGSDGFNWCYDPYHYTVPEGSYAVDTDGPARTLEFREMVQSLNERGLRVVMDVVYNHTTSSGQAEKSVLDKIVPGYYHRLELDGSVSTSTCCANTATEHAMMERLMIDSLLTWARAYKVDGFRFDLMGHHSRENMMAVKDALQSLTVENDGVDGSKIYIYGEGWNFGEVANNQRFIQATQAEMGKTSGIGSFNDRLRDAVRGGRPFDVGVQHVENQGLANGLYTDPNELRAADERARDEWLAYADLARLGLAGQLTDYQFEGADGEMVRGADVLYFGDPGAGYASDPQEAINYAAAHDNETLYDINAYKLPRDASAETRVRSQVLASSFVLLAQGIPLIHAGQDMLRSKSLDRNSYDSGDWFNILDFSYQTNGWGRGLPPRHENEANWEEQADFLGDERISVDGDDIELTAALTREYIALRKAEPLFRLRSADDVQAKVRFHNTGEEQEIGLIVMSLGEDEAAPELVVLFNTKAEEAEFSLELDSDYQLHPVQQGSESASIRAASFDAGTISAPGLTAVVFKRQ